MHSPYSHLQIPKKSEPLMIEYIIGVMYDITGESRTPDLVGGSRAIHIHKMWMQTAAAIPPLFFPE